MDAAFAHALAPRIAEVLYAAGDAAGPDPLAALLTMGPAGIVAVLLLVRRLVTGAELERVIKERDQALAENAAMRKRYEETVIPALTRLADAALRQQGGS